MHRYHKRQAAQSRYNRLPVRVASAVLLAAVPGFATAMSAVPLTPAPPASVLVPTGEMDLMEEAFREGVQLYDAGDYAAAARAWRAPAEGGHAGAQFSLGVAYVTGNGVSQTLDRAIEWWRAAAAQGHTAAQLNLGLLYWRGEGVERDLAQARLWWRRAADGGDPTAQFHLGALAATGEGGPINYKEAARWWRLSAAQGHRQAARGLDILKGHGVPIDEAR